MDYEPGTIVEYQGQPAKVMQNGTLYGLESKRIIKAPPPELRPIRTSEDGRRLNARRLEKAKEVARDALADTSEHPTLKNAYGGWHTIVKAQAELATDKKRGRDSTTAAKFVGVAAGLLADGRSGRQGDGPQLNVSVDLAPLVPLLARLTGKDARDNNKLSQASDPPPLPAGDANQADDGTGGGGEPGG